MDTFCYLKQQYPHLSDLHILKIEKRSKELLINLLYKNKFEVSDAQKEKAYKKYAMWLIDCADEMVSRLGISNAISYSENGVSITFDSSVISKGLRDEIVPIIWGN